MNIQLEKYKLMEWLVNLKDETIISKLNQIKISFSDVSDWSDNVSETEQLFIKAGLEDIENGNIISNDDVTKEIKAIYNLQ